MDLSAGSMFAALLMSSLGFGLFIYGKKQLRVPHLVVGVALMVYPYFVGGFAAIMGIGTALILGLWVAVHFGQ